MRQLVPIFIAAVLAGALGVAGCGDDDSGNGDTGSGSSPPATADTTETESSTGGAESADGEPGGKQEFIQRANAICERTSRKFLVAFTTATQNGSGSDPNAVRVGVVKSVVVPGLKEEAEEIRALGIPEGDEKQLEAYFAAAAKMVGQAESQPLKFVDGEIDYTAAEELAARYGMKACPVSPVTGN